MPKTKRTSASSRRFTRLQEADAVATTEQQRKRSSSSTNWGDITTSSSSISDQIIQTLMERADKKTKDWFTNYVKGTVWFGCKTPVVRQAVKDTFKTLDSSHKEDTGLLMDNAIQLLQREECDAKLGGMVLLSEFFPLNELATAASMDRLENEVLLPDHVADWSSADWFAMRVLRKIVFSNHHHDLVQRVLDYTTNDQASLWFRRCGVVSFLQYPKHRDALPAGFGSRLIQACENSLVTSPNERFTQTGIAWVLRYVLLEPQERDLAFEMIIRHGDLWNQEAKKSLTEKLKSGDPRRKQILSLGSKKKS